ncbi:alpha-mannosidase [Deinococcus metalli]|uniref:Alpha-mannosidase n=1 Tax=Deinococcus metalli TaxID=1141878 RepID=A0A7W8KG22_9DEIO|nr:glycoside hydrolase family 38 C-terminal domain-containing protein [Deinococcus metalli]MBB5376448.1 alpha-mannosidase [Deinococcus metalli]GHF43962.1 alpha-mannosidase [Deinococcus metalli]
MTLTRLERRLRELEAHVARLGAWQDARSLPLDGWSFTAPGQEPLPIREGEPWPVDPDTLAEQPVLFTVSTTVPPALDGQPLDVLLDVGGEGLLTAALDGEVVYCGGLNPYHRRAPLTAAARAGQTLTVTVEAVPRGLFGSPTPRPHLERARLCVPQPEVHALHTDLSVTAAAIRTLGRGALERGDDPHGRHPDTEVALRLLNLTDDVLGTLDWPSGADAHLARLRDLGGGEAFTQGLWSLPAELPAVTPADSAALDRAVAARAALRRGLAALRGLFPPRGRLGLSGHAHLDLGWLWPVHETRRKGRRTLHTVLELMKRDPSFIFNQSSAQLYAWMEHDDPELFAQLTARVHEGRFEPVGGMWVEPDGQMTGGESLARQLLYGQSYFRQTFGRTCEVAWLPDTFGFTPALPQLLRAAGITGFFTTKLNWNEETVFPHDLYTWEGLDGSRVLAHSVNNPGGSRPGLGGYNGDILPTDLRGSWERYSGRTARAWGERPAQGLYTFGYGDGGGGPSAPMLDAYDLLRDFPALPELHMTRVDDFFRALPQEGLPVWVGELYLELHRGTLTSQARVKRLNRQAEHRLLEAEAVAALAWAAGAVPAEPEPFAALWQTTLLNQFHDILPGSSIREVYRDTVPELQGVCAAAAALAAAHWSPQDGVWTVVNPASWPRPLSVVLPGVHAAVTLEGQGALLPAQSVSGGTLVHAPDVLVPALGSLRVAVTDAGVVPAPAGTVTAVPAGEGAVLVNAALRAEINGQGHVTRLYDRVAGRDVLGPAGHHLTATVDLPYAWDAWDVARGVPAPDDAPRTEALDGLCTVEVVEAGPLEASVRVTRVWRDSRITQTFVLRAGQRRLDVHLHVDWHERHTLLRAHSDVNVRTHEAWAETAMGAHARPTHRNTPADAARFEVSAHRWIDVSEPGAGLSLLNDGRYGHSVLGCALALSVVRGPMWPDPQADLGRHEVTYALYPHAGDWRAAHTTREAFDVNSPLLAHPGTVALAAPPVLGGLPLMLSSLKRSQDGDGVILRVYEPHGQRGVATLDLNGFASAQRVTLLEDPAGPVLTGPAPLDLDVRPFEILTLRLRQSTPAGTSGPPA